MSSSPKTPLVTFRAQASAIALTALVALGGCGDDGPGKLFEEDGTWSLSAFSLESEFQNVSGSREDTFLMRFDEANGVVQTAMCSGSPTDTPENALCSGLAADAAWHCNCYAYAFENETMVWKEFEAGSTPPEVSIDDASSNAGGDDGGEDTGGSGGETEGADGGSGDAGAEGGGSTGGTTTITVAEVTGVSSTYQFIPLPTGIFGSNGVSSAYTFQQKANSVFNPVLDSEASEGRPVCEPCT